jgi:preprotein translocase subunit Sss1
MRGALKSVEESAQRHLVCIARLETAHREVLETYQALVLRTHRRLGRLAMLAVLLASAALGGVGYAIYLTIGY